MGGMTPNGSAYPVALRWATQVDYRESLPVAKANWRRSWNQRQRGHVTLAANTTREGGIPFRFATSSASSLSPSGAVHSEVRQDSHRQRSGQTSHPPDGIWTSSRAFSLPFKQLEHAIALLRAPFTPARILLPVLLDGPVFSVFFNGLMRCLKVKSLLST